MLIFLRQTAEQAGHDMPDVFKSKRAVRHLAFAAGAESSEQDDESLLKRLNDFDPDKRARGNQALEFSSQGRLPSVSLLRASLLSRFSSK
jgi:hypothetical protein